MATRQWSEVEEDLLRQVRERLKAKLADRPQYPEVVGDRKLLRFLRGHDYDVSKACEMIEGFLDWRKANNVDEIRRKITEDGLDCLSKFPNYEKIMRFANVLAIDRDALSVLGNPVSAESTLPPDIWEHVSIDEYIEFRIYALELVSLLLEQISYEKEQLVLATGSCSGMPYGVLEQLEVIRDVKNLGFSSFTGQTREAFQRMAKVSSDNYPEVLRKCHIVNAPWVFGGIWTIAQMFINPKTIAKVNVLGSDFLSNITSDIAVSSIPTFIEGGTFPVDHTKPVVLDLRTNGPLAILTSSAATESADKSVFVKISNA